MIVRHFLGFCLTAEPAQRLCCHLPSTKTTLLISIITYAATLAIGATAVQIKNVPLVARQARILRCDRLGYSHEEFFDKYRWVHLPAFRYSPSPGESITSDISSMETGSGNDTFSPPTTHSSCDTTGLASPRSTQGPRFYNLPADEVDISSKRLLVSGRVVWLEQRQGETRSTKIAYPGRLLTIAAALSEDAGLWLCCTSSHEKPLGVFNVTVAALPRTGEPILRKY